LGGVLMQIRPDGNRVVIAYLVWPQLTVYWYSQFFRIYPS
jgi:hypothetical protein